MSAGSDLQQDDDVDREEDRDGDGPVVQVALDQRAAAERSRAGPHAEGAREAGVFPRVHEHEEDEQDRQEDLDDAEDQLHRRAMVLGCGAMSRRIALVCLVAAAAALGAAPAAPAVVIRSSCPAAGSKTGLRPRLVRGYYTR